MVALGVITVVQDGRAMVTLPDRGVQTPLLPTRDGAAYTEADLGKSVLVAFWSASLADGAILGVLT